MTGHRYDRKKKRRPITAKSQENWRLQWLNEALCFVSSSVVADSFVPKSPTSCSCKRFGVMALSTLLTERLSRTLTNKSINKKRND